MDLTAMIVVLGLLQVKHMFADFFLQTPVMLVDRARYLHLGRALHCLIHIVGSGICLALVGVPIGLAIVVLIGEWIVHFHIDYGKGCWSESAGHGPADASYWRAFGADQLLHQLTYLAMVWAIL